MAELSLFGATWPRRRVRFVAQMERTDCAAACLAMILRHFGSHVPLATAREACGIGRDGASAAAIAHAARRFGLEANAFRLGAHDLGGLGTPAILYVDSSHFVVLEALRNGSARILDPERGRGTWNDDEVHRRFSGVALVFKRSADFKPMPRAWPTLARYADNLRHCGSAVMLVAACAVLLELVALVLPAATQVMVDHVIQPQRNGWLWAIAAAVAGAAGAQLALTFARDRVIHLLHLTLDLSLMSGFITHLLRLPLRALQQRSPGDLMQRVQANMELRDLSTRLITAGLDTVLMLAYGALMVAYDVGLGVLVLTLHGMRLALAQLYRRSRREAIGRELMQRGRERSTAVEALAAPEMVRAFGLAALLTERFVVQASERVNATLERAALTQRVERLIQLFDGVGLALVLWSAGTAVLAERLTMGEFAGFLALHALLGRPLQSVVGLLGTLAVIRGTLERIDDVFDVPAEPRGAVVLDALRGEVALRGVRFRYHPRAAEVLAGIDLTVRAGERVAIVGRNGAGKSTLARLILGLEQPTYGQVLIDDHDLACLDLRRLRQRIGAVLQEPFVFNDTVRGNLRLADDEVPLEALRAACRAACLDDVVMELEQRYDTPLGPNGSRLSGGQRQRLSVARALAGRPALLVLDEATSHLDPATEAALQANLESLGCTQIIIAHRLNTVRHADRIVVLDAGRIAQEGRFEQLATAPGLFRDLLMAGGALWRP
jgi:ATP-binding cassette, subfamily B, bacterial